MQLSTRGKTLRKFPHSLMGKVTFAPVPEAVRTDYILATSDWNVDTSGYSAIICSKTVDGLANQSSPPIVHGVACLDHLTEGDVILIHPTGYIRTLYRINSRHNTIFATDQCNSFCLMCSQPPKDVDDSARIDEHLRLIELMDPSTEELGITGGEPTLLKDNFLRVVERAKQLLPNTPLHVLTNGRLFYYGSLARKLSQVDHPDLMLGIPLYSDIDSEHDHVVQARGAFDQTMIGLHNLGRYRVRVEIRVVIHRFTFSRLLQIAEFIYRNLPFASHIALMGMEITGFTVPNLDDLWIDPYEYQTELAAATNYLADRGMVVSVYNHQLCVVPEELWPYCRRSISDWKNVYLPQCSRCLEKEQCGGFFTSSAQRKHSQHIVPFTALPSAE